MIETFHVVDLVTTDEDKKFEPAARMATAIIATMHEQGGCLPQDLNAKGFSPQEVDKYWHMAKSLANVEMTLMSEDSHSLKKSRRG